MSICIKSIDHVALSVSDINVSIEFYQRVLGLRQIERPNFKFPGAWFGFPDGRAFHLIGRREGRASQDHHFAMWVSDQEACLEHLRNQGVDFRGPSPRPDGVQQIFFQDPDGNLIELDVAADE